MRIAISENQGDSLTPDAGLGRVVKFRIVLHKEPDGGFVATCPALPGCVSQGDTREDAIANVREAIGGVLAALNERARKESPADVLVEVEV